MEKLVSILLALIMLFSIAGSALAAVSGEAANYSEQFQKDVEVAQDMAEESLVLLKNDNDVLPLAAGTEIAIFGPGQDCNWYAGGEGSSAVRGKYETNLAEGFLQLKDEGFDLSVNEDILDLYKANARNRNYWPTSTEIEAAGTASDAAIIIISRTSGESEDVQFTNTSSTGSYYLTDGELEAIRTICESFEDVVLLYNTTNMIDISWMKEEGYENIDAFMMIGTPGIEGGYAGAETVYGIINPSGKMNDTWAWDFYDYPSSENIFDSVDDVWTVVTTGTENNPGTYTVYDSEGNLIDEGNQADIAVYYKTGMPPKFHDVRLATAGTYTMAARGNYYCGHFFSMYEEDIFVGYRYFSTFGKEDAVAYWFGYGLSYTDFDVKTTDAYTSTVDGKDYVTVEVKVTNTGDTAGKEVVQVYYSQPEGEYAKAAIELGGYAKTDLLQPGESQTMTISFEADYMYTVYSDDANSYYTLDAGEYVISVGTSVDTAEAIDYSYNVQEKTIVKTTALATEVEEQYSDTFNPMTYEKDAEGNISIFNEPHNEYELDKNYNSGIMGNIVKSLNTNQWTGAIEEAAKVAKNREREYTLLDVQQGTISLEEFIDSLMLVELATLSVGSGGDRTLLDSLTSSAGNGTTATLSYLGIPSISMSDGPHGNGSFGLEWPAEPNQARTWNTDLLYSYGASTGEELFQSGYDLWLAPNLNLHRNPINGRNCESYCEDPILTGTLATAVVRGVQENGAGVTVKHFCVYDVQSTAFHDTDDIVTERAFREFYLKGWEICIKNADPMALMTSYAMLNGTWAATDYETLKGVLREEFGWEGLIMTDWEGDGGYDAEAITNGCNLMMPGFKAEINSLYSAAAQTALYDRLEVTSFKDDNGYTDVRYNEGQTLTREDLEDSVWYILNCVLKTQTYANYIGNENYNPNYYEAQDVDTDTYLICDKTDASYDAIKAETITVDTVAVDTAEAAVTYTGDKELTTVRLTVACDVPVKEIISENDFEYNPETGAIVVYKSDGTLIDKNLFTIVFDLGIWWRTASTPSI